MKTIENITPSLKKYVFMVCIIDKSSTNKLLSAEFLYTYYTLCLWSYEVNTRVACFAEFLIKIAVFFSMSVFN